MNSFNIIVIALISLLMACSNDKGLEHPQSQDDGASTFVVRNISGGAIVSKVNQYELPTHKLYDFKVCMVDLLHRRSIINQAFAVYNGDKQIAADNSTEEGCFHWSEEISYNYLLDARYIRLQRTLKSNGLHKGQRTLNIAINPWKHGGKGSDVVFLDRKQVPLLSEQEYKSRVRIAPIYLENVDVRFTEDSYTAGGVIYNAEVITTPSVIVRSITGVDRVSKIRGGSYEMQALLIHETTKDDRQERKVISASTKQKASNVRALLRTNLKFNIRTLPSDGFYRLAIIIKPEKDNTELTIGHALFDLGQAGSISGSKRGILMGDVVAARGSYKLERYIDVSLKSTNFYDESYRSSGVYIKENLSIRFIRFANETTTERDVVFDVTACLGRSDSKQIALRNIDVTKIRGDQTQRPLQRNRCITWEDSFRHKYFYPEKKFLKTFTLTNKDLGLQEEIPVLINPWDFGWTFGRDARLREKEVIEKERTADRPQSKFYVRDYRFVENGTFYKIDKSLSLIQVARLRFSLDAKVERPSSQTKGVNQVEKLRKGKYLFRILVRRNNVEEPERSHEYIAHAQTITTVTDGNLVADVELPIRDQSILRSRNSILIELSTIKEDIIDPVDEIHFKPKSGYSYDDVIDRNSGLAPAIFEGPVILSNTTGQSRLYPYKINSLQEQKSRVLEDYVRTKSNPTLTRILSFLPKEETNNLQDYITLGMIKTNADINVNRSLHKSYTEHNNLYEVNIDRGDEAQSFIKKLLSSQKYDLFKDELKNLSDHDLNTLLENPHQNMTLKRALCYYFANTLIEQKDINITSDLLYRCLGAAKADSITKVVQNIRSKTYEKTAFSITRQYITDNIEHLNHIRGIPYSYNIRTGYSLSMSKGYSLDAGIKIPVPGSIFGISGGGGAGVGWRWSQGTSTSTGLGLNLDIEENIEHIRLHQPRKCLAIRLSPHVVNKVASRFKYRYGEDSEQLYTMTAKIQSQGLLLCKKNPTPYIDRVEHYYYLEQSPSKGIYQDPTDIRNRQVRFKMRGKNEFFTFLKNFEGELGNPSSSTSKPTIFSGVYEFMRTHVNSTPANYPGVYTDLEESQQIFNDYLVN